MSSFKKAVWEALVSAFMRSIRRHLFSAMITCARSSTLMNWLRCPYLIQTNGRNGLTAVQRIDAETRYAPSRPTLQGSPRAQPRCLHQIGYAGATKKPTEIGALTAGSGSVFTSAVTDAIGRGLTRHL